MEHWRMRCFNCMAQLDHEAAVCPRCGWDNRNRVNGEGMLEQTVLNDQYLIGRALGRGGFGVTYTGFDLNLQLRVAIKEYFPISMVYRDTGTQSVKVYRNSAEEYENGLRRALDESRTVAGLGHVPNVVRVYNVFRANGTVYIVMEYIDGTTLAQLVGQRGRMEWKQALTLLYPIMRALEKVHGKGIIHRDVSPDNIMLDRETNEAVLLDFGAAREAREGLTTVLRPGYAPLEQYSERAHQDGRVDEYALCATMYFLIAGEAPASADLRAYAKREMKTPRSLGCDIPPEVEAVLLKGMAVQADDRYESVAALRRAFEESEGDKAREQDKRTTAREEKTAAKGKMKSFGLGLILTLFMILWFAVYVKPQSIMNYISHLSDRSGVTETSAMKETQGRIQTGEISDSWEQIIAAIDDGSARQRYAVGATKVLDLGELGTVHMQLAGFDLDDRADGQGKAATTWIAVELLPDKHVMNEEQTTEGGWKDSDLRTYLQNAVLPAMPSNIREKLIRVNKQQKLAGGDIQVTEDNIWIPDKSEIYGTDALYYDLFQNSDANRVKSSNGSAAWWWLRSAGSSIAVNSVGTDGNDYSYYVYTSGGVALGFCL